MSTNTIQSSLIIATYNWKEALELVLLSIVNQSVMPFEVIIADDGSRPDTKKLIDSYREKLPVPLVHIWHEDKGFRLSVIRNKAIKQAKGNYIIQIDGDTILHKDFVKDHQDNAQIGQFISGSRVLLNKEYSEKIIQNKNFKINIFSRQIRNNHYHLHLPFLAKFLKKPTSDIDKVIHSVRGCNMSFWKNDLLAVNGYNEDMIGWGREDSELSARLVNYGLKKINLKFSAIQYHIYHPEQSKSKLNQNDLILKKTIETHRTHILNGIYKNNLPVINNSKIKITAIIPTLNEEKNILQVIDNLHFADEILIIDSYSTDKTVELAKQKKIKLIQRKFDDFSSQKNYAIKQASNDWIIILDADERMPQKLINEILSKIKTDNKKFSGFWIPRKNYFLGKKVRFSGWQNDKVLRLFNKNNCTYNGKLVHEEIVCKGKVGVLKNNIIHYTFNDYDDYLKKIKIYSALKAKELYANNVKPGFYYKYIKPTYRFIYHYIISLGFLDGKTGYTIAKINAIGMKERYYQLKKLYKNENRI